MSAHRFLSDRAQAGWEFPDPGDGEAIFLQHSGFIHIETGASGETNTLSDPDYVGQILGLVLMTDGGGDRVITADSDIDQSGNNVATFATAGQFLLLMGVRDSSTTLKWEIIENLGSVSLA